MSTKAYKFRLRPTATQRAELERILALCRELYNGALEEKRTAYKRQGVNRTCAVQQGELTELKVLCPEYAAVYAQVLQNVLKRLHGAFDAFFRRVKAGQTPGYPRFKGRDRYDSFTFPQVSHRGLLRGGGVERLPTGRLKVHGLTGALKVVWHRTMQGLPKTATFKREGDHWYVFFACVEVPLEDRERTGVACGVDVGLTTFAALDDGTLVENPRLLRTAERALVKAQRTVSRRKRGSKRRNKARKLLAKQHRRVANARRDFHHKEARKLVRVYDRIAVEDLNIAGLARGMLSKSIHDAGWAQFLTILASKAAGAGCEVVKVNASGTSQQCAACDATVRKDLSVRVHRCPACGYVANRDVNAAQNIYARAFGAGKRPSGSSAPAGAVRESGRHACVDPRSPVL